MKASTTTNVTDLNEIQTNLQEEIYNLLELVNDDNKCEYDYNSIENTLQSIVTTLQQYFDPKSLPDDNSNSNNDDDKNINMNNTTSNNHNFIRTNLANYKTQSSSSSFSSSSLSSSMNPNNENDNNILSLRSMLNSKSTITKLLNTLIQIMTKHNHCHDYIDNNDDDDDDDDDHMDYENRNNDISLISLQACHVYVLICLLSGSWSTGWIDLVAMRYVETIVRKWKIFCCEYKMKLTNNRHERRNGGNLYEEDDDEEDYEAKSLSRPKRGRYQKSNQENDEDDDERMKDEGLKTKEEIVYNKIQNGIGLSKTLSCILSMEDKSKFWNWNTEARDAFFDSIVIALSSCAALIPKLEGREEMKIKKSCHDAVMDMSLSLEGIILSSVEGKHHKSSLRGGHDDIDDQWNEVNGFSSQNLNSAIDCDHSDQSSLAKETTITILRNLYPLLTYQVDLPNGVRGKQAAFEQCQSIIAKIVHSLSSHLKSAFSNQLTPSKIVTIDTPRNTEINIIKTPLTGKRGFGRPSITPKSTNRKLLSRKGNGFEPLIIPPSLKKSVTPKRVSHRKSLMMEHSFTATTTGHTSSKKNGDDVKQVCIKEILDIFVAMMQKLSTGQNNSMERVEVRTRISTFVLCVLDNMKVIQKIAFVKFVMRLCSSKVSSHRIFGVEMLCSIVALDWIWEENIRISKEANVLNQEAMDCGKNNTSSSRRNSFGEGQVSEFPHNQSIAFLSSESNLSTEILVALKGRVMDRSPAVRARVAIALSAAVKDIKMVFSRSCYEKKKALMVSLEQVGPDLIESLRQRAKSDDKATVRKAALLALVDLLLVDDGDSSGEISIHSAFNMTQNDVKVLCQSCNDLSVIVRKAAVDSIVQLIERQQNLPENDWKYDVGSLEVAWVNFVLPLVRDESSCVSKIVESFESLIIAPILDFDSNQSEDAVIDDILASRYWSTWKILSTLNYESSSTGASAGAKNAVKVIMRKFVEGLDTRQRNQVCITLLRQLNSVLTRAIKHKDNLSDKFVGSWCLLEVIGSLHANKKSGSLFNLHNLIQKSDIGTEFVMDSCNYLLTTCEEDVALNRKAMIVSAKSFLHVVSSFAHVMDVEQMKAVALALKELTKSFHLVLDLIAPSATALVSLASAVCRDKPETAIAPLCTDWIKE